MKKFAILSLLFAICSCIHDVPQGADLKVGDSIPSFSVAMNDGTVISQESVMGKPSVIVFFHTLCSDCQEELPLMQRLYDEYASKGVVFALISRAQSSDDIESYWKENGLKMPYSAQKDRTVYEKFATESIPRVYINDRDGIIRYIYTDNPVPSYDDLKTSLESVIR